MTPSLQKRIAQKLNVTSLQLQHVGGGSINQTFRIATGQDTFFCKVNSATKFPHLFEKEAKGLQLLRQYSTLRVPEVIGHFCAEGQQVLLLEWIQSGPRTSRFWKSFGSGLAALHHVSQAAHGLDQNNYMGSVEQANEQDLDWCRFFIHQRLQPLVQQCTHRKLLNPKHQQLFERLYHRLPDLFATEPPALLHGDLWSGNYMCDDASGAVLIDPAVYYGHRSMDLGMTTLFGGFDALFYQSYHYHYPLPSNYTEQWQVCNLYPLLIHLRLFGSSYLSQIESTLKEFA
jgi:protein-ribulosamine 3-kinase